MKFFLFILILIFSSQILFAQNARKHALLIGVSEYARGGDPDAEWWNLNAGNDVAAFKETLQNKFDFKPSEIRVLRTKRETTHQAILNALNNLIASVKTGDIVYLHYSGHGAQILDDNADEIDGLDESLVPSDYATRDDGSKNIRDDQIGKILNALRLKNPSSVTFTFDSCFSGTITRDGRFLSRGEKYRGKKPTLSAKLKTTAEDDSNGLLDKTAVGKNFVVISAARSDETAKETGDDAGNKIGALTYSIIRAFSEADSRATYRDVFERAQYFVSTKNPQQNPQIEGALDAVLLSGAANPTEPYVGVRLDENNNLILQAGSLHGMTKDSRFAVYPNGTKQTKGATALAEATIEETNATTSKLKIDAAILKKHKPETWQTARAFEVERAYAEADLKVALDKLGQTKPATELIADLKNFPLVRLTTEDDWDLKISVQNEEKVLFTRADSSTLAEIRLDENLSRNARLALEREARFRVVQSLENNSPDLNVELRVVPVAVEKNARGAVTKLTGDKKIAKSKTGKLQFSEGEYVALEVRNKGYLDAYITILDLTSDGKIGAMYPHPSVAMPDNKIPADGEWRRLPLPFVFKITPPAGTEIYKLIATRNPIDFSPLLDPQIVRDQTDARVRRALENPLGKILRAATLAQRSNVGNVAPPDWSAATVRFEVVSEN